MGVERDHLRRVPPAPVPALNRLVGRCLVLPLRLQQHLQVAIAIAAAKWLRQRAWHASGRGLLPPRVRAVERVHARATRGTSDTPDSGRFGRWSAHTPRLDPAPMTAFKASLFAVIIFISAVGSPVFAHRSSSV
ncbi:uncharacterized protein SCHCODRAFT_02751405 [Schizophyllum commune H4-8]|uniref:uncharacterized protein n=1 Tax=Schizophyllum commune (strain H4-8 / FGSC 9210) TaxID=578458 RepID=UPI00215DF359|nr:uncharacterized protein SCHCODRAFT_02751405 [Schizophyllum commune H4-8]KAI5888232.1 hypothetical protein SCHCODRAFT_02751405 [Schizophyllum commune H4-8]